MKFWKRFGGYMPILATIVVVGCVGTALKGYAAPVYEVEQPENIQSTEADAKEKKQETEETEQAKKGNFDLADGFYKGSGTGFAGTVSVSVEIKDKSIIAINILSTQDDEAFFNRAKGVIDKIIAGQTLDVDVVSGATYSSNGIINAVKAALESAKAAANPSNGNNSNNGNQNNNNSGNNNGNTGNNNNSNNNGSTEKPDDSNTNAPTYYADGSYTVTVKCEPDESEDFDAYNLTATITVKGDKITAISNVSGDGDSSNDRYINWAANGRSNNVGIISQIIGLATIDMSKENAETTMNEAIANVDVVSRATCSSQALKDACKEALNQARAKFLEQKDDQKNLADVKMPDGTDETGNADTELTDPENDPQEAAQEQLLETE